MKIYVTGRDGGASTEDILTDTRQTSHRSERTHVEVLRVGVPGGPLPSRALVVRQSFRAATLPTPTRKLLFPHPVLHHISLPGLVTVLLFAGAEPLVSVIFRVCCDRVRRTARDRTRRGEATGARQSSTSRSASFDGTLAGTRYDRRRGIIAGVRASRRPDPRRDPLAANAGQIAFGRRGVRARSRRATLDRRAMDRPRSKG